MDKKTEGAGRYLLEERRTRRHWATLVVLLAILVSTGTFFVLRHNAIAATYKKRVLDCQQIPGTVAHVHNDDCYDKTGLVCPLEEIAPHLHTSECYENELVCGLEESMGHVHTKECWVEETDLVCGLEEHVHGPECYELALICDEDEALPEYDEAGELVDPGHVHTEACYGNELICEEEEHVHSETCWETSRYTVCGMEEGEGAHQHDESCYVSNLICGQEELPVHFHDANCFITVDLTPEEVEAMRAEEAGETVEGETEENQELAGEPAEGADAADETAGQTEPADGVPAEGDSEDGKETTDKITDDEETAVPADEVPAETVIDTENYPAQHFEGEAAGLLVTVNAHAGAFPKDTRMVVSPIEDENVLNAATAEVQGEVVLVQGVDISFYVVNGNEIEPLLPIQVEMIPSVESSEIIPDMTEYSNEQTLVHVDNELAATVMEQEDNLTPEVRFESDSFSAYIVVYTKIEKTVLASDGNN